MVEANKAPYIVTLPPPTPNGGLHVGHMAGPFLAADVFAKQKQNEGHEVFVLSFSDTNQTYVKSTAERLKTDPHVLAHNCSIDIQETLAEYGSDLDYYFEPNAQSNSFVRTFFLDLYAKGALIKKPMPFFFSLTRNCFLGEADVGGFCPNCFDDCKCGICEACGQLTDANTLLSARDVNNPEHELEVREVPVLALEMERCRGQLEEFHANNPTIRPKYRWLVEDCLATKLMDFPVSTPGTWGISLDHPDFPEQVINAWPEIMANFYFGYEKACSELSAPPHIVNFFGYDNSIFYALTHVALLYAGDLERYLPTSTMINEFFNLEDAKFSTSRGHLIWARDICDDVPADLVRLYCCLVNPGFEESNFRASAMEKALDEKLFRPWSAFANSINQQSKTARGGQISRIAVDEATKAQCGAIITRITAGYSLERFNLRQSATDALRCLEYLCSCAEDPSGEHDPSRHIRHCLELLMAWTRAISPMAPVLAKGLEDHVARYLSNEGAQLQLPADLMDFFVDFETKGTAVA